MSINLYVSASRLATVTVKGKTKQIKDTTVFDLLQTPTALTRQVMALPSIEQKVEAYCKWAADAMLPYEEDIVDYDGAPPNVYFDYPIIGTKMVDPSAEHVAAFRAWIQFCEDEDYVVDFAEG